MMRGALTRPIYQRTSYRASLRALAPILALYLGAHALDTALTLLALARHGHELNPLLAISIGLLGAQALVGLKVAVALVTALAGARLHQYAPRLAAALLAGLSLAILAYNAVSIGLTVFATGAR
jgi:hypothetical protein